MEQVYADHINALSNRIAELEAVLRDIREHVEYSQAAHDFWHNVEIRIDAALNPERDAKPPSV